MLDDNYIVNRIIDILNNENKNLLVGNITSPRPGSICQVSTKYGIKSAYNINCTYPGNAIVVWDKDEEQYYCFTTNPSTVLNSTKLSYRKNREIIKPKKTDNYIKILYKSTIGNTVKVCVGGCYETPKVLVTYQLGTDYSILDEQINSTGKKEDEWIVGLKERTQIQNFGTGGTLSYGNYNVYEGSSSIKYTGYSVLDFSINRGRGYFQADAWRLFIPPGEGVLSGSNPFYQFTVSYPSPGNYNAQISKIFTGFNKVLTTSNLTGTCVMVNGSPTAGILGITGILNGLIQGTGTIVLYNITKSIRSILPGSFSTINGFINNVDTYETLLVGNKDQYIYDYIYNISVQTSAQQRFRYVVSASYGEMLVTLPFNLEVSNKYTNWNNNTFNICPMYSTNNNAYIGSGIKEVNVEVYQLQPNGTFVTKPAVKAKYYGIPKATNETISVINASYYLD